MEEKIKIKKLKGKFYYRVIRVKKLKLKKAKMGKKWREQFEVLKLENIIIVESIMKTKVKNVIVVLAKKDNGGEIF